MITVSHNAYSGSWHGFNAWCLMLEKIDGLNFYDYCWPQSIPEGLDEGEMRAWIDQNDLTYIYPKQAADLADRLEGILNQVESYEENVLDQGFTLGRTKQFIAGLRRAIESNMPVSFS